MKIVRTARLWFKEGTSDKLYEADVVENDALSAPDGRAPTPVRAPVPTNSAPAAGSQGSAAHPANPPAGGVSTGSGSATPPPRDEK
jgi:hypothetical protein